MGLYTDRLQIENYLMTKIDSGFDPQIDSWIKTVERFIDNYTNRLDGFGATDFVEYFYDGNGERELIVNSFIEIEKIIVYYYQSTDVIETLTEGKDNDFIIYPYNRTPKYKISLTPNAAVGSFYSGDKRIGIEAKWGYSNIVPEDIKFVATVLVSDIVKQGKDGGIINSENLLDWSADYEKASDKLRKSVIRMTDVRSILNSYKLYIV